VLRGGGEQRIDENLVSTRAMSAGAGINVRPSKAAGHGARPARKLDLATWLGPLLHELTPQRLNHGVQSASHRLGEILYVDGFHEIPLVIPHLGGIEKAEKYLVPCGMRRPWRLSDDK